MPSYTPMFQRRHYEAIAQTIKEVALVNQGDDGHIYSTAQNIADMFQQDNPHFKRELFMAACGMPE